MAEAGTIESDDAIIFGGQVDQAAGFEILDHAAIAVQENQRRAGAAFDIVKPDAIDFQEPTGGRIIVLGILGQISVDQGRYRQSPHGRCRSHDIRMRLGPRRAATGKGSSE
jgi:hypothetical protein